jgi:hypothetical protein
MWMDGSYGNSAWIMAGGDTLVIRGCTALGTQGNPDNPHCRIGSDNATNSNIFCQGVSQYWGCAMPPPPNGTAGQHTRILGGCAYGTYSCTPIGTATTANGYPWTGNNLTQLFSGFNAGGLMYLYGASYIDVEGLELTTHNGACTTMGSPAYPKACSTSSPVDDFGRWGIVFTNTTTNILLQDVYIHGFTNIGIGGPFGAGITLTRVFSGFNAFAGWNMDDGSSTPDGTCASLIQSYVTMIGNGCLEQYPIANAQFPAMACWDSNDGGFGDAWSGQNTNLDTFTCDHCNISYNGKDAALGPHTLVKNLTYTNSITVGNMGQQGKWGMQKNSTAVFENDLLVGNCYRMSQQLPGAVQNFALSTGLPGSYLSNYCRASGDTFSFFSDTGSTVTISNNTFISYQPTVFDFGFGTAGQGAGVPYVLKNNIFFGYNTGYTFSPFSNSQPGLYYLGEGSVVVSASNDIEFGVRNGDPCSGTILCVDPLLVNEPAQVGAIPPESALDNFNFHPTSGSPAIGAGTSYSGMLPTDYYGNARPTSPAIGAVQP